MFDKGSGRVKISKDLDFEPGFSLPVFTHQSDYNSWTSLSGSLYQRDVTDTKGRKLTVWLNFRGTTLQDVLISFFLPHERDKRVRELLQSWSPSDPRREAFHRLILSESLGEEPYQYPWGFVALGTSDLDLASVIMVHYNLDTQHDPNLKVHYGVV